MAEIKEKPYIITFGTDNRPGGVEGEYHLQFKPDIMNVTFGEQEEVAKEFGGTMRVTNGQEWADFYHEADAVKFAEKVIGMNQERETAANKKKEGTKITVKGSHGKVLNLIPSDDPIKNRIVETLKDRLVFHDAKSVDDVLDKTKDSYEMKVWNRLNKELWEIAYRKNNSDISLNISPSDDLSKIKVIEHERRYYGQSDIDEPVGDFDLKDLSSGKVAMEKTDTHPEQSNDDISKVGFFKSDSGKNAGKYILYWEDDKGKNHRVYDLLDRKERYIISAFFKAVKEGRKEEFLNDLVSKLSKAQEKEVKKSDTNTSSESKLNEVVDSYKAVIAASHKLIDDPRKWELHKLARVLIGVDNGTDERYHSLTPEEKMEFYKEMASCEKDTRYAESFKAIDKLSGGKMSLLASHLTDNDDINMVTAIEAVQSPERSILSGKYNGGLIVYHGTAYHDVPFDKFEEDKPIWFTSDLSYAKGYAESRTGMMGKRAFENFEYFELDDFKYTRDDAKDMLRVNQDLRIARLDLKNPAIIGEPHDYLYPDKLILWLKDLSARLDVPFEELDSIKLPDYVGDWHNQNREVDTVDFIHNPDFMKILENHGYDGMVTTEYGDYHVYCYAAFHNDQIREITPNDQEWNLVDTAAKQLKAAYRASWVEEGHREEVFDTVEKIFKERPSISPKERLQGGFLDKRFEKMGIKLIDSVNDQAVKAAQMGAIQQTDQNKQSDIVMKEKNLKNQNMTSDSESVRIQLYDELSMKLAVIMPKHGDGVYLAMPLRMAEDPEKPIDIERVYHDLGKKPGEFVCANMFYHVNMSDMSSDDLRNLFKVFDKKLHTNPDVTETKLNKATAAAKEAIHDRIVIPTARRFTSDQVESMKHYRSLFPVDTDTGKLFTHLHEDVCKQEDVACKPEKWKSDALRELNDLADGITRDQGQGLKR